MCRSDVRRKNHPSIFPPQHARVHGAAAAARSIHYSHQQVLYTHQKTKKAKTWQDGTLRISADGTRAALHAEKDTGPCLETILLRAPVGALK